MNSDEPAWYYVGDGRLRLWDGTKWTDRYRLVDAPKPPSVMPRVRPVTQDHEERPTSVPTSGRASRAVTWALVLAAAIVSAVVGLTLLRGPV